MIIKYAAVGLSVLAAAQIASVQAAPLSVGVATGIGMSPYKQYDTPFIPYPAIHYDDDSFYIQGLTAGVYAWNDGANKFSVEASYAPFEFKPSKTDNDQLSRLNHRRSTMMAGIAYSHDESWGRLSAKLSGDTLDHSNGLIGDLAYHYSYDMGEGLSLVPGLGVEWASAKQNSYYFGVSDHESALSGLKQYQPGSSWQPYLELMANYAVNSSWNVFVSGRYMRLDSTITDSPMVNKSYLGHVAVGTSYTF
jgi:outer membrane protein